MYGALACAAVFTIAGALTFTNHAAAPYAWATGGVIISIFVVAIASRFSYRASDYIELSEGGMALVSVQGSHTLPWATIALLNVTRTGALELSDSNRLAIISISRRFERYKSSCP